MNNELFSPIKIRNLEIPNRIMMSPMCQYSAYDGIPNEWHYVHYGTRAVGGVGLIMVEATAIVPEGRITPWDLGLWEDGQVPAFTKIAGFIDSLGVIPAIQLGHAGRKASTSKPWEESLPIPPKEGGWNVVAPSPIPFASNSPIPHELSKDEINDIKTAFKTAVNRAYQAGFKIVEIHSAHGYLLHEFLSPLSNKRTDEYGGSLENRQRLLLEIAREIRDQWPDYLPVFVRISATDWVSNGWTIEDTIDTAQKLADIGIDLIDASSGGNIPDFVLPEAPAFQVPFSEGIKENVDILTAAVGGITLPEQAEEIIDNKKADIVALGRELLRNPYWTLHAAKKLGVEINWPNQYLRAK